MKPISVVICNFNKQEFVLGAIMSVKTTAAGQADILVVDNASTDRSVELIRHHHPDVTILTLPENIGGSGGFAHGMQYAYEAGYAYITLLDNDAVVLDGTLADMMQILSERRDIGVVGPAICKLDQPDTIQEVGANVLGDSVYFELNHARQSYAEVSHDMLECDYVPACCLMTRREVIEKIGVFDSEFFLYWDDIDWCARAKLAGWRVFAAPQYRALHKGGGVASPDLTVRYYLWRNRILFFKKNINLFDKEQVIDALSEKVAQYITAQILLGNHPTHIIAAVNDLMRGALGKYSGQRLGDYGCDKVSIIKQNIVPGDYHLAFKIEESNLSVPLLGDFTRFCEQLSADGYHFYITDERVCDIIKDSRAILSNVTLACEAVPAVCQVINVYAHVLSEKSVEYGSPAVDLYWNCIPSMIEGRVAMQLANIISSTMSSLHKYMYAPVS